jgi:DNA-directed RNA polymerase specialized sigma24 family protein
VINFETYHEVRRLSRELNLSPNQIAAETGLNIKTIRKWLDNGQLDLFYYRDPGLKAGKSFPLWTIQ